MNTDASDNARPANATMHQPDNFNRAELYKGMSGGMGGQSAGMPSDKGMGCAGGGDKATHIDFAAAGDIYGGKASQSPMAGGGRPDVQQAKMSTEPRGQDGARAPQEQTDPSQPKDRFGMTHGRNGVPNDGIVKPNVNEKGPEMTPDQMMIQKRDQGRPFNDGSTPEPGKAKGYETPTLPNDQVVTSHENGKVNEVSSYNASDNTLTKFSLDGQGQVASRSVTDMKDNSTDTVNFGDTGQATSHQVTKPGQSPQDLPVNDKDHAYSTKNPDGSLKTIDSSQEGGSSKISFGDGGQPTSIDKDQYNGDGSSTSEHEGFAGAGNPYRTETKSYDTQGKLRTDETKNQLSTSTNHYDDNGKVVQNNYQDSYESRTTNYLPDRAETFSTDASGTQKGSVKMNDGSSADIKYEPYSRTTTGNVKLPDGSISQMTDNPEYRSQVIADGRTGNWLESVERKPNGNTQKSYGNGTQTYGKFSETPI